MLVCSNLLKITKLSKLGNDLPEIICRLLVDFQIP